MDHFTKLGWSVEDTHLAHPFDARATKDGQIRYLEAKGWMSDAERVLVTRGEVEWARQHPRECVMGIVSGVRFHESTGEIDASSGTMRLLDWAPDTGHLAPVQYEWTPLQ